MTENSASSEPTLRFKRRKTTHARRVVQQNDAPIPPPSVSDAPTYTTADSFGRTITSPLEASQDTRDDEEGAPNLKEILRNRKRPRDRLKEVARKLDMTKSQALVPAEAPKQDVYGNRFVAQTGQIVDVDDQQMAEYVEARLAEKNLRLHGWPIPKHLEAAVASLAPDSNEKPAAVVANTSNGNDHTGTSDEHNHRLAAGKGKLQEVELASSGTAIPQDKTSAVESTNKVRLGKDGKPRRHPKRRNSEDLRRDQIVEAVLREAKLDYFEEDQAANAPAFEGGDNDEAMAEQFRQDFLESLEARHKRRPAAPTKGAKGVDNAKKIARGPKLGGSRSARAAMHMKRMEEAAKSKR